MEIQGVIKQVIEEPVNTKNGVVSKYHVIITTFGEYPKDVCVQYFNPNPTIASVFIEGAEVTLGFNPESREYKGRFYTELRGWSARDIGSKPKVSKEEQQQEDDLPF